MASLQALKYTTKHEPPPSPAPRTLLQLARALCHPLLVFDAYTFRWLTFDPRDVANNKDQAFTKVTNIGLISALILTVFASWVQAVATTSYASYGRYERMARSISSAALNTGVILLVMSVINSVLLLLAVNDAEDDHHATVLLRKIGLWFTLPALYFYLGVLIGTLGWFIWVPAVFPLASALFTIAVGVVIGLGLNAGYYQFIVLSVYDARDECGLNIPGPPAVIARFTSCGRKPAPKIARVTMLPGRDDDGDGDGKKEMEQATRLLEHALHHVGHAELLTKAVGAEWNHIAALSAMEERHALDLALPPGAAVRFLLHLREKLQETRSPSTTA